MSLVAQWWDDLTWVDEEYAAQPRLLLPAFLVSLLLHLALILVLGTIWQVGETRQTQLLVASEPMKPVEQPKNELQQFRFSNELDPRVGSRNVVGTNVELSRAPLLDQVTRLHTDDQPVQITDIQAPMALSLGTAPYFSHNMLVKGAAGVGAIGAVGAVDRVTQEILLALEERKTLVVWLFDRSASMQSQRQAISARVRKIYDELKFSNLVFGRNEDRPLLSAVMSFGSDVSFLVEPTGDLSAIDKAVSTIPNDESGVELVFTAVSAAAQKYQVLRTQGRRHVMFVVFTDEVGDDEDRLEATVQLCRRNAMPVYVVGVPAPFGRRNVEIKFVDPDPKFDQSVQWIPVRQGPETLLPEEVSLGFAGHVERDDDLYRLDSGFGPYCLTRLCYETGGIYFAVHANRPAGAGKLTIGDTPIMSARLSYFFDPTVMRGYAPDYLPPEQYKRLLLQSKARTALVEAAQRSMVMPMNEPRVEFPKGTDEAAFKRVLDEAQKAAAVLEPKINSVYEVLKQGEVDRPRLAQPRWQAAFDLAMGRVLAVKVRTEAYNGMLAKAKTGMKFEHKQSNVFLLVPADEISVGSSLDKMARQAREYLSRVAKEHAGTPWALLAETELKEPIGWKWSERYDAPPPPAPKAQPRPPVNVVRPPQPARPAVKPPPPKPRRDVKL